MTTPAPITPSSSSSTSKKGVLINNYVTKLKAATTPDEVKKIVEDNRLFGEHLRSFTIDQESVITRAVRDARARVEKLAKKKPSKGNIIDEALRAALSMHDYSEARWQKLIEAGASNNDIWAALIDEFKSGGGSQTESGIQFAYQGLDMVNANHIPTFWLYASTHMGAGKPTLKGDALVKRVREVLSIPQVKSFHEKEAPPVDTPDVVYPGPETIIKQLDEAPSLSKLNGIMSGYKLDDLEKSVYCAPENVEITREAILRAQRRLAEVDELVEGEGKAKKFEPHEFKPTTSRGGRCSVCNKASDTTLHRAWKEEQRERMSAGQPKQTAEGWRAKAEDALANVTRYRKNPHEGKNLTDARQRDWEGKLSSATIHRRWGLTMEAIATAVESGTLPPILNGLTNQYQVRQLMDCVIKGKSARPYGVPQSMGPTIKTAEEFAAGVKALSPLVPIVEPYTVDGELQGYGAEAAVEPPVKVADAPTEDVPTETSVIEPPAAPAAAVAEVFYALDLFKDKTHDITYLKKEETVDLVPEDSTAVIGVNADGLKRVVSTHNLNLPHEEIIAKYGSDARLEAPHTYNGRNAGDGSGEDPCCVLPEGDPIHDVAAAIETQTDGQGAQAVAVTAVIAGDPYTDEVEVELNDHDIALKARQAAALATEIAELEGQKKESDAKFKKAIGGKEEERDKLLREIGTGRAALELRVYDVPVYERRIVETRRCETGRLVKTRDMKPREFEQRLFN